MRERMIETDRLKLRDWREADKSLLSVIHADPEVMQFLGGTKTASETSDFVDQLTQLSEGGEPTFWATERIDDGSLIGAVGLHWLGDDFPFGPALEVGWRLGRDYWGKGYATEAARAVLDYAFGTLDVPRVYAFTALKNKRSEIVMQRLGMTRVEGGEFPHPDYLPTDPSAMHMLYIAEKTIWTDS
ncbi:GNAT family N-acetyltransferase [Rhizobium laguerreae]|nr:GNAT family N-acetyltransferase [Rhizobium laguerreae]